MMICSDLMSVEVVAGVVFMVQSCMLDKVSLGVNEHDQHSAVQLGLCS
jgi:hypothetical protein